jgi:hypothetical protein
LQLRAEVLAGDPLVARCLRDEDVSALRSFLAVGAASGHGVQNPGDFACDLIEPIGELRPPQEAFVTALAISSKQLIPERLLEDRREIESCGWKSDEFDDAQLVAGVETCGGFREIDELLQLTPAPFRACVSRRDHTGEHCRVAKLPNDHLGKIVGAGKFTITPDSGRAAEPNFQMPFEFLMDMRHPVDVDVRIA